MHVGLGLTFQNLKDTVSDTAVFRHELDLAARAEDQGFDSVWTPEHHFTGYSMSPAPLQLFGFAQSYVVSLSSNQQSWATSLLNEQQKSKSSQS